VNSREVAGPGDKLARGTLVNAHSYEDGLMLERVSQCIFQLPKADQDCWQLEWGSQDKNRNYVLPRAAVVFQPSGAETLKPICSLPALAGRAADPHRPQPCEVANLQEVG
jgi:hypothetical protein